MLEVIGIRDVVEGQLLELITGVPQHRAQARVGGQEAVVEIDDGLHDTLQRTAAARGVSVDTIVIEALTLYLEREGFGDGKDAAAPADHAAEPTETRKPRQAGTAKGMIIMGPDFDEPLEDFKDYM